MRLLVTKTAELAEFLSSPPPYAILSHRWRDGEITLQDLSRSDVKAIKGYSKLAKACQKAQELGFEYLWMDTCCIDKRDSVELSEAINSMYMWYTNSGICLAFLDDIRGVEDFLNSVWFSRGWTLQELIAPAEVIFYTSNWSFLGTRTTLATSIEKATGIEWKALLTRNFDDASVAKKMSWASRRVTTRLEDEAYCLMGIFDVNMPAIYGEGRKAFIRLQEEILKKTNDHSIFAWGFRKRLLALPADYPIDVGRINFMADRPSAFEGAGDVVGIPFDELETMLGVQGIDREIVPTYKGIRMSIPVSSLKTESEVLWTTFLACKTETEPAPHVLGMFLERLSNHHYARIGERTKPLLEIPSQSISSGYCLGPVELDDQACILRDAPSCAKPVNDIVVDITSLHNFCTEFHFTISGIWNWKKTAHYKNWSRNSTNRTHCTFKASGQDSESCFIVLKHKNKRVPVGVVVSMSTEPDRYARGEKHIVSVETHPIGKSEGCIPYHWSRKGFPATFDRWKLKADFGCVRSVASNTILPNGLSVMSMITCDTHPTKCPQTNTDSHSGLSYKLSVRSIKTT